VTAGPAVAGPVTVKSVRIQNFRSLKDLTVKLDDLTILIGANGTGKTTVLDALALFASTRPAVGDDDYRQGASRIDITLTVAPGGHAVPERFLRNGVLRLQRSFSKDGEEGKRGIKAEVLRNRDLAAARGLGAKDARGEAEKIRASYPDFPPYKNLRDFGENLDEFEFKMSQDPRYADRYREEFVEYPNWQEAMAAMLVVIPVPAMKDISADGEDGGGSRLSELMDLAVRGADASGEALERASGILDSAYAGYMDSVRGLISDIGDDLAKSSEAYMDGARFEIDLENPRTSASHPAASVRMGDGGFMAPVDRAGSGFQRVYLLSLLDTIANRRRAGASGGSGAGPPPPLRIVAIDEPELYQHPQRQRRMLKSFIRVAGGDSPISIVCSTHSPYFVELRKVDKLRLLHRGGDGVRFVTLGDLVAPMLGEERSGSPGAREELSTWLDMNATHWITEGFFARLVAMVEGHGDRNMLLATASAISDDPDGEKGQGRDGPGRLATDDAMDIDLDSNEISIVPADGVGSMPKFMRLFGMFGISAYPIWDLDHRHCGRMARIQKRNRKLAGLACGAEPQSTPQATDINLEYSCFEDNLTVSLAEDLYGCADLLEGNGTYNDLCDARNDDRIATQNRKRQRKCKSGAPARGDARKKDVIESQKKFLDSKLNVFRLLRGVKEKDPGRLERFDIVRVVRMLDTLGREAKERAEGRRAAAAASAPPPGREGGA